MPQHNTPERAEMLRERRMRQRARPGANWERKSFRQTSPNPNVPARHRYTVREAQMLDRSMYQPYDYNGKQECARRCRQMAKGIKLDSYQ